MIVSVRTYKCQPLLLSLLQFTVRTHTTTSLSLSFYYLNAQTGVEKNDREGLKAGWKRGNGKKFGIPARTTLSLSLSLSLSPFQVGTSVEF